MTTRVAWRVLGVALAVGIAAFAGYCLIWQVTGNHWEIVESPSMGTWAPVGTLLWVSPVAYSSIKVGQVIAFHPPTDPSQTYSHRVLSTAGGVIHTKGDLNGTVDPWTLHAHDVIGRVESRWWDMGWVVKGLPIVVIGGALLWVLTRWFCRPAWRLPARITGVGLILSLAIYAIKPLVRAELLSLSLARDGARARIVGTGILPVRLRGSDGSQVDVREGQVADLLVRRTNAHDLYTVHVGAHLPLSWIIIGCIVLFLPALYGLAFGLRPQAVAAPVDGSA